MIKFFRKIRQSLLAENRFNKYLLYALGEILLVVIGILIALQINNWNEYRKERILEASLLGKIAENIAEDIDQYGEIILQERNVIADLDSFLTIIRNPLLYELNDLDEYMNSLRGFRIFTPNKSAFTNLISSGKINVIENSDLLDHILRYYSAMDAHGAAVDAALSTYTRNQIGPYIMNFDFMDASSIVSAYRKRKSLLDYHQDPAIDNHLSFKILLSQRQIVAYEGQIMRAKNILTEIDEEIKK